MGKLFLGELSPFEVRDYHLGLLLGHSIYSVLVTITGWLKGAKAFRARLGPILPLRADEVEIKPNRT